MNFVRNLLKVNNLLKQQFSKSFSKPLPILYFTQSSNWKELQQIQHDKTPLVKKHLLNFPKQLSEKNLIYLLRTFCFYLHPHSVSKALKKIKCKSWYFNLVKIINFF